MVCPYEGVYDAVLVFHALEMVQRRIPGKQTIRSYPFAGCTFHGKNFRSPAMVCPPHAQPETFDVLESHRNILYAEVIFYFKTRVKFPTGMRQLEWAFVREFPRFPAPSESLLAASGCVLLCNRQKVPIFTVVPLHYILGHAFFMPSFDPQSVPRGNSIRGFEREGGSPLLWVNYWASRWGRLKSYSKNT